mmetsp:Transcript_27981/g.65683  ORF Transcript_27981/g.65683 Transcript_27981/m.65683 type:complete len:324 (+) Transcript_27981:453-1424(+)
MEWFSVRPSLDGAKSCAWCLGCGSRVVCFFVRAVGECMCICIRICLCFLSKSRQPLNLVQPPLPHGKDDPVDPQLAIVKQRALRHLKEPPFQLPQKSLVAHHQDVPVVALHQQVKHLARPLPEHLLGFPHQFLVGNRLVGDLVQVPDREAGILLCAPQQVLFRPGLVGRVERPSLGDLGPNVRLEVEVLVLQEDLARVQAPGEGAAHGLGGVVDDLVADEIPEFPRGFFGLLPAQFGEGGVPQGRVLQDRLAGCFHSLVGFLRGEVHRHGLLPGFGLGDFFQHVVRGLAVADQVDGPAAVQGGVAVKAVDALANAVAAGVALV